MCWQNLLKLYSLNPYLYMVASFDLTLLSFLKGTRAASYLGVSPSPVPHLTIFIGTVKLSKHPPSKTLNPQTSLKPYTLNPKPLNP